MDPIETLMTEHRGIERIADSLEGYLSGLDSGDPPPLEDLHGLADLLAEIADRAHHAKEESVLFEAMHREGFPVQEGPIACMLHEHDEGRRLVHELAEIARNHTSWTPEIRTRALEAGTRYVALIRQHIQKEDQVLFPMAQRVLPDDLRAEVARRFEEIDRERDRDHKRATYERLAESLAHRYAARGRAA